MGPDRQPLVMYSQLSDADSLDWEWARSELAAADMYWVSTSGAEHPHPRPVWGVWHTDQLFLSIGSPRLRRDLQNEQPVTVHLASAIDVVILEGAATGTSDDEEIVSAYDAKYDWQYDVGAYGQFIVVSPQKVMAWRSAGRAGREGFAQTARWTFSHRDG